MQKFLRIRYHVVSGTPVLFTQSTVSTKCGRFRSRRYPRVGGENGDDHAEDAAPRNPDPTTMVGIEAACHCTDRQSTHSLHLGQPCQRMRRHYSRYTESPDPTSVGLLHTVQAGAVRRGGRSFHQKGAHAKRTRRCRPCCTRVCDVDSRPEASYLCSERNTTTTTSSHEPLGPSADNAPATSCRTPEPSTRHTMQSVEETIRIRLLFFEVGGGRIIQRSNK